MLFVNEKKQTLSKYRDEAISHFKIMEYFSLFVYFSFGSTVIKLIAVIV